MTHKFPFQFDWTSFYGEALKIVPPSDQHRVGETARMLLEQALDEKFPGFEFEYDIDGTDEENITILIEDAGEAMLFKLTHGGAA
jgi:hypothetical protein